MASPIDQELATLVEDFDVLGEDVERLGYVMDLGRALPPLAEAEKTAATFVPGCASKVWLVTERTSDGTLVFRGDAEALIPKGVLAVLLKLFSGRTPGEILSFDAQAGLDRLGLASMLTPSRSNGLYNMLNRIRLEAAQASP
jgi:cysteine desulfuration protein SufE